MTAAQTQPARGMRDFLPEDVRRREYVIGVIADVYRRYGFEPLETPAVENIETLMGKYGEEGDRLIFKILKRGEEGRHTGEADLALRYDLTVPLARVVAEYRGKLPKFFKRYQVQPVWRADRPQKGRFREFYQCDVDVVGSTSPVVEVELCSAVSDVLSGLGFGDFVIRLNHRQVLAGLLDAAGVEPTLHGTALVALDKLEKVGAGGVQSELVSRGLDEDAARRLLAIFERAAGLATTHPDPGSFNRDMLAMLGASLVGPDVSAGRPVGPAGPDRGGRTRNVGPTSCASRSARLRRPTSAWTRASRAGCRITPAPSWRSPCPIWPAAWVVAAATMASSGCFLASRCPHAGSRSALNGSWWS